MAQGQPGDPADQVVCPNCAGNNPASASFCAHCGQAVRAQRQHCVNCGTELQPDAQFCPSCGAATNVVAPGSIYTSAAEQPSVSEERGLPGEIEFMGFWIRAGAWVVDLIVLLAINAVLAIIGLANITFFTGFVYGVLFIGLRGQTPGKMALGIKVVNAQGDVPGIGRAALREILGKLASAIVFLLGFFWVGWDRQKRGWHDHIAGTFVVRK